ncbi:hypothetical protein K450DRAFT_228281 [Umbelopsis ramanniana AG]|uniref:Uncharacterized protein n=1 Tax=Umbelopsis ramanniana AG TaxID=1314678 RepID=A0AAD5EF46_UMBRA|nr:uncharacterized protein K450DRAFT_228281 [Umbelopsis ramanniana AG]KAI8582294.1 hypothetical protein K450DRAFT_228281 [Umbelopsis ramanniana AG]
MSDISYCVFSGGSACNHIVRAFQDTTPDTVYILGIGDNGGSTSELLRVIGGPSIGDLRSRLTRLINLLPPESDDDTGYNQRAAIKTIMSYRLPAEGNEHDIKDEWSSIVEGRHKLWEPIPVEKKETIRGFLTMFDYEILKRSHKRFNFRNGSIGNFFLTGARLFFGSLEAAIFLFSAITGINEPTSVIPVINTNHTASIAAILENGETLKGQCEISHPAPLSEKKQKPLNPIDAFSKLAFPGSPIFESNPQFNDNLVFSKTLEEKLHARIARIYYMNEFGQEIYPIPSPKVLKHLSTKNVLVFSIGSLYTSIVPCLILRGVGNAIAQSPSLKHKILILNGNNDRETHGYTALDFIDAITTALNESRLVDARRVFYQDCNKQSDHHLEPPPTSLMHHLRIDTQSNGTDLKHPKPMRPLLGVDRRPYPLTPSPALSTSTHEGYPAPTTTTFYSGTPPGYPSFPQTLFTPSPPNSFITTLLYLSNSEIEVDVGAVEELGIKCIQVPGGISEGKPVYDDDRLRQALESVVTP